MYHLSAIQRWERIALVFDEHVQILLYGIDESHCLVASLVVYIMRQNHKVEKMLLSILSSNKTCQQARNIQIIKNQVQLGKQHFDAQRISISRLEISLFHGRIQLA